MSGQRWRYGTVALICIALQAATASPPAMSVGRVQPISAASAAGTWTPISYMSTARANFTATTLRDGRVLVAGGMGPSGALASAEIYDPGTGTWTPTGSMADARYDHTATLLLNGDVLVAGGSSNSSVLASAEVYDPNTGVWTQTGPMAQARSEDTATLLPDGRVLVAGGAGPGPYFQGLASAEIYDPSTGIWSYAGSMADAHYDHTATLLSNGKVLVAGGESGNALLSSAELYDPATNTWSPTGALNTARMSHMAALLPTGQVLVMGGVTWGPSSHALASAELYDPNTGAWTSTGSMSTPRAGNMTTTLYDGTVLVSGGNSAEIYDPDTGTWAATSNLTTARSGAAAALLPSGQVLAAGGSDASFHVLNTAEVYTPGGTLILSPTHLDFGDQAVGTASATQTLTVTNASTSTIALSSTLIRGIDPADFTAAPAIDACVDMTLAPGETCTVAVGFAPTSIGARTALLSLVGQVVGSGQAVTQSLTLDGNGLVSLATPTETSTPVPPTPTSTSTPTSTVAPTDTPTPRPTAVVTLNTNVAWPLRHVVLSGQNFGSTEPVAVYWDSVHTRPLTVTQTLANGAFQVTLSVPQAISGTHEIIAVGQQSLRFAAAPIRIVPAVMLVPSSGAPGAQFVIAGVGFGANEPVTAFWNQPHHALGSTFSNALGSAVGPSAITATIPLSVTVGQHIVYAVGWKSHGIAVAGIAVH